MVQVTEVHIYAQNNDNDDDDDDDISENKSLFDNLSFSIGTNIILIMNPRNEIFTSLTLVSLLVLILSDGLFSNLSFARFSNKFNVL